MERLEAVPIAEQVAPGWLTANQMYLGAEFARIKEMLRSGPVGPSPETLRAVADAQAALDEPSALERLAEVFALTAFERDLLLLCAGVEMDSELGSICAELQGRSDKTYASFGLALAAFPDPHWTALSPQAALRRYRLLEIDSSHGLSAGALRIDERALHYLAGVNLPDTRLDHLFTLKTPPHWIADSHQIIGAEAAKHLAAASRPGAALHFYGDDPDGQEDTATEAAHQAGSHLFSVRAEDLPSPGAELDLITQLWRREALLLPAAVLVQCGSSGLSASARQFLENVGGPLMLASREPFSLQRPVLRFRIDKPVPTEQKQLWDRVLPPEEDPEVSGLLADQFRFSAKAIARTANMAAANGTSVREACRTQVRPKLEDLAQRISCKAGWSELVLPPTQIETLHHVLAHVRHRMTVHETWGFAENGRRGLGVSALFTGESGTGKTLAAEVLAHELSLDLYRVDLASVVSKYIGESEKNLRQIFDAAEEGGVALLFDEADALFGKRTEVKDSHDRYANIQVNYLLQRLEAFQGLAILTTNFKASLDRAFQRRLRFTIHFPFPDAAHREEMWRRVFPAQTPTEGLDPRKLSQLHVTGGNIRNIALHAAFLAARQDQPVTMAHVLEASRMEAQNIERPLSASEVKGWA